MLRPSWEHSWNQLSTSLQQVEIKGLTYSQPVEYKLRSKLKSVLNQMKIGWDHSLSERSTKLRTEPVENCLICMVNFSSGNQLNTTWKLATYIGWWGDVR